MLMSCTNAITLLLEILSAVAYDSIESENVDWAFLRMRVLIFQCVYSFELPYLQDEATKRKTFPRGRPLSSFAQNVKDMKTYINFFIGNQVMKK